MDLMTVSDEGTADSRSNNRWSANKKLDVVLRLLRGEKLEEVGREVGVEAHRLEAWRDEFLDAGKEGLKGKRGTTEEDRRLRDAERKIGELTLENEVWKKVAEKWGSRCRRRSGRGECGDADSPGQGVRHYRGAEVDDLSPSVSRRRPRVPSRSEDPGLRRGPHRDDPVGECAQLGELRAVDQARDDQIAVAPVGLDLLGGEHAKP